MEKALWVVVYLWAFWGVYVLVMGLYRAHMDKRLSGPSKALAVPFVAFGYFMDALTNWTIACVVFIDPPQEVLVTTRLRRYLAGFGWRKQMAEWVCTKLLDPFDPTGRHCD